MDMGYVSSSHPLFGTSMRDIADLSGWERRVLDSRVILDDDLVRLDDKDSAESETPSPSTVEHAESV